MNRINYSYRPRTIKKHILLLLLSSFFLLRGVAQIRYQTARNDVEEISYAAPQKLTIKSIKVQGSNSLDDRALIALSGLKEGDEIIIPGHRITNAINRLWEQGLMEDVSIFIDSISDQNAYLILEIKESPRLSEVIFSGVSKSHQQILIEKSALMVGRIINATMVKNTELAVLKYYREKGYMDVEVSSKRIMDKTERSTAKLIFSIEKHSKIKLNRFHFTGNNRVSATKLKKAMRQVKEKVRFQPFTRNENASIFLDSIDQPTANGKALKRYLHRSINLNIFGNSKVDLEKLAQNKSEILAYYQKLGYRNAKFIADSIVRNKNGTVDMHYQVEEGKRFYIRNITWNGNFKHSDAVLSEILGMGKGDVYSLSTLNRRLNYNPKGRDVSSLYIDNGHLLFDVKPVEISIENDSVDIEMRVVEGDEFVINKVSIKGNNATSEHVIRRELRTLPGQKFSREDVVRSTHELAALGFLDPQSIDVNPIINAVEGTVDIEYIVEEKSGTELQASAGIDPRSRFYGTIGASLNNFSARKLFKPGQWKGLPIGDGQKLQLTAQSNASTFKNFSLSFSEPWFGGKKDNSFSVNLSHVVNSRYNLELDKIGQLKLYSATIGLGKRLRWPDDYFQIQNSVSFNHYQFEDYNNGLGINNGTANSLTFNTTISRYKLDNPIYPKNGSSLALKLQFTPPYSLLGNKNYESTNTAERHKLVEFHKYDFDASFFVPISGNLIFHAKANLGFIGAYSNRLGIGPFERYNLGGSGIGATGDFLVGTNPIGLRAYDENSLNPIDEENGFSGGVVFNKFTFELRYPLSFTPLIYVLAFAEAGNTWNSYKDYNPNQLFKSAGIGIRINLPGMGMIGVDYGRAFDTTIGNLSPVKKAITFSIGAGRR